MPRLTTPDDRCEKRSRRKGRETDGRENCKSKGVIGVGDGIGDGVSVRVWIDVIRHVSCVCCYRKPLLSWNPWPMIRSTMSGRAPSSQFPWWWFSRMRSRVPRWVVMGKGGGGGVSSCSFQLQLSYKMYKYLRNVFYPPESQTDELLQCYSLVLPPDASTIARQCQL